LDVLRNITLFIAVNCLTGVDFHSKVHYVVLS